MSQNRLTTVHLLTINNTIFVRLNTFSKNIIPEFGIQNSNTKFTMH